MSSPMTTQALFHELSKIIEIPTETISLDLHLDMSSIPTMVIKQYVTSNDLAGKRLEEKTYEFDIVLKLKKGS